MSGTRFGSVAVLGLPNAGKSTLVNRLAGARVSIVTHKAQTTRTRVRGIGILGRTQAVFVDTPGLYRPKRRLDEAIVSAVWAGLGEADAALVLVDAAKAPSAARAELLAGVDRRLPAPRPRALVANKIDRVRRESLLALVAELNAAARFDETFLIAASNGDGVDRLAAWIERILPAGPWHYPEEQAADMPLRLLAAEITREKLLLHMHDELPYQLAVEPVEWAEGARGRVRIEQRIVVARESHRRMIVGRGGTALARIREAAARDIAREAGSRVDLSLQVKVRRGWMDDPRQLGALGLEAGSGAGEAER